MPLTRDQIIDIKSVFKSSFDDLLKDSNFIHRIAGEIIKTLEKNFDLALKKYEQRCELSENEKLLLNRIDDYEQYTRRNNVRIFGIPEDKGEDVQDKVLQLCKKKLNMNITTEYIDRCHRVGSKKDRSPIIVKFIRHDFKQNMLNNRRKLKNSKIFVAEDLTTKRYQFFTAICKKFGYKNVQTRDGNILIKIDAVLHKIRSANDFEKFKQIQGLSMIKVFKKSSPNNKLTLYLSSRDLVVSSGKIDRVQGVLLVDPEFVEQRKVYGQVTLTFRYGREDEEVMGLKFCNEAVMCLAQLYPPHAGSQPPEANTPLQDALIRRLGPNAYPFTMEITPLAPPSVQLVPAKEYSGAPIGTSYDVRAYIAERIDEKIHRRTTVRMGIRVVQRAFAPPSPYVYSPGGAIPSSRDRYKQKITLFGCQTAPLEGTETHLIKQNITNSEELRLTMNRVYDSGLNSRKASIAPKVEKKMLDLADRVDGYIEDAILNDRTPTHIVHKDASKENLQNDNGCEENKKNELMETNHEENIEKKEVRIERKESILSIGETTAVTRIRSSCGGKRPSLAAFLAGVPPPHAMVEKPFLLSDGRIELEAQLNKGIYYHGEEIFVSISVRNSSNKSIRRIKVFVVQHVDVCMFSNGKFKNIVAVINSKDNCPISSGSTYEHTYGLVPTKSSTKNWIALEDSYTKSGTSLASSVMCSSTNPDDRNVFAIYVSYYVKVKLIVSVMGREVSIKLPFTLMHTCNEDSPIEVPRTLFQRKSVVEEVKPEKDGT